MWERVFAFLSLVHALGGVVCLHYGRTHAMLANMVFGSVFWIASVNRRQWENVTAVLSVVCAAAGVGFALFGRTGVALGLLVAGAGHWVLSVILGIDSWDRPER